MRRPTLFLMVGLPAAGKTTAARRLEVDHDALRLTKDEWMKALYGEQNPPSASDVIEGRLIEIRPKDGEAADVVRALDEGAREVARVMDVKVGELGRGLRRAPRGRTSALGNLLCDLMREHAAADVAFTNKTGIRADLEPGDVRLRHLHQVSPFGNTVVSLVLDGADLLELIEGTLQPRATFEASGLVVRYDSHAPRGRHVGEVVVAGKPLDPTRAYRVATNSFLADGGDNNPVFTRGRDRRDDGTTLLELTRRHFAGRLVAGGPEDARFVDESGAGPADDERH